jgi:hypothetical protein
MVILIDSAAAAYDRYVLKRTHAHAGARTPHADGLDVRTARSSKIEADQRVVSVTVANRDVPPRQDKTLIEPARSESAATAAGLSREQIEKIVADRIGLRALAAQVKAARWIKALDLDAVGMIITGAVDQNLRGDAFERVVSQRVEVARRERTAGLALPFGIAKVKG